MDKQQHPFYTHWVHQFFNQYQGNRGRSDLGRTEIHTFLQRLTGDSSIADWQVKQALEALEIYYEQFRGIALEAPQAWSIAIAFGFLKLAQGSKWRRHQELRGGNR